MDFHNNYLVTFHVDLSDTQFITEAQLRLKKTLLDASQSLANTNRVARKDRIDVFTVTEPANYGGNSLKEFVVSLFLDPRSSEEILVINVTDSIISWLKNSGSPKGNVQFELTIRCPEPLAGGDTFLPNFQFFSESDKAGQLIITTYNGNEDGSTRRKRNARAINVTCDSKNLDCCLESYTVNFHRDLNWTWVVRPPSVSFNYCSGQCPIRWLDNRHSAHVQTLRARVKKNPAAAAEPCCIPNSFRPIHLVASINDKEVHMELNDVAATSCICR